MGPDYARAGVLNPDICCYRRAGMLDGLRFVRKGDEAIVVTTGALLRHWLKATPDFKPATANPTDDPSFYQWTGTSDWSVLKSRGLGNGAFLASGGPESDPHWIALTVTKRERVYIVFVRARTADPAAKARALTARLEGQ